MVFSVSSVFCRCICCILWNSRSFAASPSLSELEQAIISIFAAVFLNVEEMDERLEKMNECLGKKKTPFLLDLHDLDLDHPCFRKLVLAWLDP